MLSSGAWPCGLSLRAPCHTNAAEQQTTGEYLGETGQAGWGDQRHDDQQSNQQYQIG
jgi:hypothetical protein